MDDPVEISVNVDVLRDVVFVESEPLLVEDRFEILGAAGDLVPFRKQTLTEVRAQKPCGTCDENPTHLSHLRPRQVPFRAVPGPRRASRRRHALWPSGR